MLKTSRKYWLVLLIVLVALTVAACGGDDSDSSDDGGSEAEQASVTVQFNWIHDSAWAGFYAAEREGYYANENLDVEFQLVFDEEGNFLNTVDQVVSGAADFGIDDSGNLLQARLDGKPVVAIATVYQRHPLVLLSLEANGITTPEDLPGRVIQTTSNSEAPLYALLAARGIDPSEVTIVERTDYSVQPLLSGEADVIDGWLTNEVPTLTVMEEPFNMILPSEYGVEIYPNLIFTTEEMIANNPDLVLRFLRATLEGIEWSIENVDGAVDYTLSYDDTLDQATQLEAMRRSVPLTRPAGTEVGQMTAAGWELSYQILRDQGVLSEDVDVNNVYTLQFLNEIYQ